ncbi:GD17854 [Drosophila simulans]|uniref:GD17854 n=1 Tax=Drosophila simulans TaxID=7240 RepID=B4NUT0_DROSI|nr:GD17854 [Drosophila simulans]
MYLGYYQWVFMILLFQSLLFYFPSFPVEGVGGPAHGAAVLRGRRRAHRGGHLPHPPPDAHQILPRPVRPHPLVLLDQVLIL